MNLLNKETILINKYFKPLCNNKESLNLKNDAAIISPSKKFMILSSDMMIEDVHFNSLIKPKILAKKLLRVNLSDVAAMGGDPYGYLLNIALPSKKTSLWLKHFCQGLLEDQAKFKLKLFGGDLSCSNKVFLSVSIFGKSNKEYHDIGSSSKLKEIFVSGTIGDSIMGYLLKNDSSFKKIKKMLDLKSLDYLFMRHDLPEPRIKLGKKLKGLSNICTDLSDGLISELKKINFYSKNGSKIFLNKIPLSQPVEKILNISSDKIKIWEYILTGGEDYELIFDINKNKNKIFSSILSKEKLKISVIGSFTKNSNFSIYDNEKLINIKKSGFSHF